MLHVGLTGNIASGKSTVAARFRERGARVLDADAFARDAVAPGTAAHAAVLARFGPAVAAADGTLDRAALGRVVFADAAARRDLERIVHPEVAKRRAAALDRARAEGARIVVSDVPLLYETGMEAQFDCVVVVDAPDAIRRSRLVARGMAADDATRRMAAQGDPAAKRTRADFVITNDGSLAELTARSDAVWELLAARATA